MNWECWELKSWLWNKCHQTVIKAENSQTSLVVWWIEHMEKNKTVTKIHARKSEHETLQYVRSCAPVKYIIVFSLFVDKNRTTLQCLQINSIFQFDRVSQCVFALKFIHVIELSFCIVWLLQTLLETFRMKNFLMNALLGESRYPSYYFHPHMFTKYFLKSNWLVKFQSKINGWKVYNSRLECQDR